MYDSVINEEYMEWLEYFSRKNGNFDTRSVSYEVTLTSIDKFNLKKFNDLYNELRDYANANGIEERWTNQYSYYSMKYNDKGYSLLRSNNGDGIFMLLKNDNLDNIDINCNKILESNEKVLKLKK